VSLFAYVATLSALVTLFHLKSHPAQMSAVYNAYSMETSSAVILFPHWPCKSLLLALDLLAICSKYSKHS
jgi:hypothetical protein